jgi:plasmid stabilization system protein ParE
MVKQITWADEANETFETMTTYLQEEYSLNTAIKFADAVYAKVNRLTQNPEIGQPSPLNNSVRIIKINKNVIMFYSYDGYELFIIDFFNTRQDPKKRKY